MAKCEILLTTEDGQKVAGVVIFGPGGLLATPTKGYEVLMKNVMATDHEVDGKEVSPEDMKAWFESLPRHYSGSYMRARMIGK